MYTNVRIHAQTHLLYSFNDCVYTQTHTNTCIIISEYTQTHTYTRIIIMNTHKHTRIHV